jgi:hypothetical protein
MEGSPVRRPLRLARYLEESGTYATWLARALGVPRNTLHGWLSGRAAMPERHREEALKVLRRRAGLPLDHDLFESEE